MQEEDKEEAAADEEANVILEKTIYNLACSSWYAPRCTGEGGWRRGGRSPHRRGVGRSRAGVKVENIVEEAGFERAMVVALLLRRQRRPSGRRRAGWRQSERVRGSG